MKSSAEGGIYKLFKNLTILGCDPLFLASAAEKTFSNLTPFLRSIIWLNLLSNLFSVLGLTTLLSIVLELVSTNLSTCFNLAWTTLDLISNWFKTSLTASTFCIASSTKYISLYPSANLSNIHWALASPLLLAKPVIFSKGISNPWDFKNSCIATADAWGRAVKTNISFVPNFSALFLALLSNGPGVPSTTLLNSEKSNSAPLSRNSEPWLANSSAVSLPLI